MQDINHQSPPSSTKCSFHSYADFELFFRFFMQRQTTRKINNAPAIPRPMIKKIFQETGTQRELSSSKEGRQVMQTVEELQVAQL